MRWYMCKTYGDGNIDADPETPFRPRAAIYIENWTATDARKDQEAPGWMLVHCQPTLDEHQAMNADADITYLPIHGSSGEELDLDDPLSMVSNPAAVLLLLDQYHVPRAHLTMSSTVRQLLRTIVLRMLLRQILKAADFSGDMDTLETRRAMIQTALAALQIVVDKGTTREMIMQAILADSPWLVTGYGN